VRICTVIGNEKRLCSLSTKFGVDSSNGLVLERGHTDRHANIQTKSQTGLITLSTPRLPPTRVMIGTFAETMSVSDHVQQFRR